MRKCPIYCEQCSNVLVWILPPTNVTALNNDYLIEVGSFVVQRCLPLADFPFLELVLLDDCNVFYALRRPANDEDIDLIIREKSAPEADPKKTGPAPHKGHKRTPSGFSLVSTQSRWEEHRSVHRWLPWSDSKSFKGYFYSRRRISLSLFLSLSFPRLRFLFFCLSTKKSFIPHLVNQTVNTSFY